MRRTAAAVIGGLIVWTLVVTLLNLGLEAILPGYRSAQATLHFTVAMKAGRLIEGALSSLIAGAFATLVAPSSRWAAWIVGLLLLALFLPVHVQIWNKLPLWYHLTFLLTLAPLVALGGLIPLSSRASRARLAA